MSVLSENCSVDGFLAAGTLAASAAAGGPDDQRTRLALLKQYWGYEQFLPFQAEAVEAILSRQDALVILPTGGGKSLCYQLPALMMPGVGVVVSPLVSLMKDQVDTLNAMGIAAGYANSSQNEAERAEALEKLRQGAYQLFYVAPERFELPAFMSLLQQVEVAYFVVDEAHCISQWGHDFRPAYRGLSRLREAFPGVKIHAFTATATPQVQADIAARLNLSDPRLLVGRFARLNLLYRVQYRTDLKKQVMAVLDRHPNEGGIVYCISRKEVEELAAFLRARGYRALPYHAGLSHAEREAHQEAFMSEQADIVVATVAFGMGIDRPDIRFVVHAGMPKSIEHYQQEAGRAGRDREPAECVLLYSGSDVVTWRTMLTRDDADPAQPADPAYQQQVLAKLFEMSKYCQRLTCRHRFLVEYFGQPFAPDAGEGGQTCGDRCDYCLGECQVLADSLVVAQKILSAVYWLRQRFGAGHVADTLLGASNEKIQRFGHDQIKTYGILRDARRKDVLCWIDQLLDQGFLSKEMAYQTLQLTPEGGRLLRGEGHVVLSQPVKAKKADKKSTAPLGLEDPADMALFEALRRLRREIAAEKHVAPFIVFNNTALAEIACHRPDSLSALRRIKGVGDKKCAEFGERLLSTIRAFDQG